METHRRNEAVTRYRPPRVTPLELWDLWVEDRVLWETMLEPDFPAILGLAIETLRRGQGRTRNEGQVPGVIAGFDSLYVAGRRSSEASIRASLFALEMPVVFSTTPDHPGQNEGLRLLRGLGSTTGWICDLGQSCFKISCATHRMQFERDLKRLPIGIGGPEESLRDQRRELREWLTECIRVFATNAGLPDALLFALPSRLDDQAVPEGSSYIGMAGDRSLFADVIDAGGLNPREVLAINDAELAALDALAEPALGLQTKTLVITIGFGVGAALVFHAS